MLLSSAYQDHVTFNSEPEVQKIVSPFLNKHNLSYFSYVRMYPDGAQWGLTNLPGIAKDYYEMKFYNSIEFSQLAGYLNKPIYLLWEKTAANDLLLFNFCKEKYSLGDGLAILIPQQDYMDTYYFATNYNNTSMVPFYLNERHHFTSFIENFKLEAQHLIKAADTTKFVIPDYDPHSLSDYYNSIVSSEDVNYANILPPRQMQVLYHLARGDSCKTIAIRLGLKVKTVYFYIQIMKNNLNLKNRSGLIQFYWDMIAKDSDEKYLG